MGRFSPHPYVRDHLHDLNMKFSLSDHMDDSILNKMREEMDNNDQTPLLAQQLLDNSAEQQLRQRRRSSTAAAPDNQALQKASRTLALSEGISPLVKRGLQGIFYVGIGLALLGLIGKIVNPTWQPLTSVGSSPSTEELEQKVNDMELQNNLMRAEIDLLTKQVKYLSTLSDPQQQKQGKHKDFKESKTFKAWSGNGDSLKPVDITKHDLKKPYKCPDGSFVEIANMCIEQSAPNEPSIVDQFEQVVEDLKEQSEAFKTFEKVAEELQGFQDNPFEELQEIFAEIKATEVPFKQFNKNKPIYETTEDYKQNLPYAEKYQKHRTKGEDPNHSGTHKSSKYERTEGKYDDLPKTNKEDKKVFGKNDYKNSKEYKKHTDQDNSRDNSKYINNSRERKYRKDNSKERFTKDFDGSKENSKENHSKERFNKQTRKFDKNSDHDESGEWQERYMKNREHQRKQNGQKYQDNKNWYIKRGDSRENRRSDEKQYR